MTSESAPPDPIDVVKTKLECRKLELEIAALTQSWWRRPAFIGALLPTVLAAISLTVAWQTGYFQAVATKLENQRHDVSTDVTIFEYRKARLTRENETLARRITKQTAEITALTRQRSALREQIDHLDVPVIANGTVRDTEWDLVHSAPLPTLFLRGANFGVKQGLLEVAVAGDSRFFIGPYKIGELRPVVEKWTDQKIEVTLHGLSRASVLRAFPPLRLALIRAMKGRLFFVVSVQRPDKRRSPATWIELGPVL